MSKETKEKIDRLRAAYKELKQSIVLFEVALDDLARFFSSLNWKKKNEDSRKRS